MRFDCYLGLGSNLRSPARQIHQAIARIRTIPRSRLVNQSSLIMNQAVGRRAQPSFCNAVIKVTTTLPPHVLLRHCQAIEVKQGRVRKLHWGARTLDIDLLLYGNKVINSRTLKVPHPEIASRPFVFIPLLELFPGARELYPCNNQKKAPKQIALSAKLNTGQ